MASRSPHLFIATLILICAFSWPEFSHAKFSDYVDVDVMSEPLQKHVGGGFCKIVDSVSYGKIGPALATLAVLTLGFGSFFGKVNWSVTVIFSVAIAALFGAAFIVNSLAESGAKGCKAANAPSSSGSGGGSSSGSSSGSCQMQNVGGIMQCIPII